MVNKLVFIVSKIRGFKIHFMHTPWRVLVNEDVRITFKHKIAFIIVSK